MTTARPLTLSTLAGFWCWWVGSLLLVAILSPGAAEAQFNIGSGNLVRYYPPPNFKQVELRIKGDRADVVPGFSNRFDIARPQFSYFQTNGEPMLFVQTPQCIFDETDSRARSISSQEELVMQTGDKQSSIQGRGFNWQQTNMVLVISNDVRALIRYTNNAPPLEITSRWFEFDANRNLGIFHENVRGEDTNQTFTCETLTIASDPARPNRRGFDLVHAEGGLEIIGKQPGQYAKAQRGTFRHSEERIDLIGAASWQYRGSSGSADQFTLWAGNTNIDATGNVRLSLPRDTLGAAGNLLAATNQSPRTSGTNLATLQANKFTKRGDQLLAEGGVRINDGTNQLTCDRLDGKQATLTSPQEYAVATGNVFVGRDGGGIYSDRADYSKTHGQVLFTGNPRFQQDQARGTAERIIVHPATSEVQAEGGVKVQLTFAGGGESFLNVLPDVRTNRVASPNRTNETVQVVSKTFTLRDNRALFAGEVEAHQLPMDGSERRMTSAELEVRIAPDRKHVEAVQARQNVVCEKGVAGVTNGPEQRIYSRLECETLTANTNPKTGELVDLIANGKVRVLQAETEATGEQAVFKQASQTLQLIGQSMIDRPEATYTSSKGMSYNLGTGGAVGGYDRIKLKPAVLKESDKLPTLRPHE